MPSLTPTGYNALKLLAMRDKLVKTYERSVSWNEVLSYFFKELKDQATRIKELENQVEELGGKVEHKTDVIEQIALNLSKQPPPMMMQSVPIMTQNTLVSPPPPPQLPPKTVPLLDIKPSGNLKQDLIKESKMVFDGQIRSPSEILKLCKPPHENGTVKEFTGDEPSLTETSHLVKLMQNGSPEIAKFKKAIKL